MHGRELWVLQTETINTIEPQENYRHNENDFRESLFIYPNPTQDEFSIDFGQTYQNIVLTLKNITGQIIESKSFGTTNKVMLNIPGPRGFYFLKIDTQEGYKATIKILKN